MAKGDFIEVYTVVGGVASSHRVTASKAGRTVRRRVRSSKTQGQWVDIDEMTRTGRPAGATMNVRMEVIVAIREEHFDGDAPTLPRKRRVKIVNSEPGLFDA